MATLYEAVLGDRLTALGFEKVWHRSQSRYKHESMGIY